MALPVRWIRRGLASPTLFVVGDQAIVSLGNFCTNLVLIRTLEPGTFGVYAVIWSVLLLLNMFQSSLIVHPMLVTAAASTVERSRMLAGAGLSATLATSPFGALVVLAAAAGLHRVDIAGWIFLSLLSWQLQEVLRRALMSRREYRRCIPGDAVSYLGQALVLVYLSHTGKATLPFVFGSMSATSALAAAIQALQARPTISRLRDLVSDWRKFWNLGRWIANLNIVAGINTTALPWALAYFRGSAAAGGYQALLYLIGIVQPLAFSLGSIVAVETSRWSFSGRSLESARGILRPVAAGGLVVVCYSAVLLLFPTMALRVMSGPNPAYLHLTRELRLFALTAVLFYAGHMLNEGLIGLKETRKAFFSQCWCSLACVAVGIPLLANYGIAGAAVGLLAAHFAKTVSSGTLLHRTLAPRSWAVAEARAGAGTL